MDYQVVYGEANWRCHFYYGLQGGKIIDVPGTNSSSGKLIEMDISNLKGEFKPYFKVYAYSGGKVVWARIRSIYLE